MQKKLMFRPALIALLALTVVLAFGCEDRDAARSRLVVSALVPAEGTSNLVTAPYQSDIRDAGEDGELLTADDAVYEDLVVLTLENQARSGQLALDPSGPFGSVTLTSYRVDYDLPDEQLEPLVGAVHAVVPTGESVTLSLVLVTAQAKVEPPLYTLLTTGQELQGNATLTVYGTEETSDESVTVSAAIRVHFANWADGDD